MDQLHASPTATLTSDGARPSAGEQSYATPPPDFRDLLHPSEQSRLVLALSASAMFFGGGGIVLYAKVGWSSILVFMGAVALLGGIVWVTLQVIRSRLLGNAVRVDHQTLPELQETVDEVRGLLRYEKRLDAYVLPHLEGGSAITGYLGTRILILDGDLVAELMDKARHRELVYLIARNVGQLKAKHQRLTLITLAMSLTNYAQVLNLFLLPYYRATVKSGDQIGAACCGDARATATVMHRLLAGKDLGPHIEIIGVLQQALDVRHRFLPRLAQLTQSVPHATNRYLNLLEFLARVAPAGLEEWKSTLAPESITQVEGVLDATGSHTHRRRSSFVSVLAGSSVTCCALALVAWAMFGSAPSGASTDHGALVAHHGTSGKSKSGATHPAHHTRPHRSSSVLLLAHIPSVIAPVCTDARISRPDEAQGVDEVVNCSPTPTNWPLDLSYTHYRSRQLLYQAFDRITRTVPSGGDCLTAAGQFTYTRPPSQDIAGHLACYTNISGQTAFMWTDDYLNTLVYSASNALSFSQTKLWWEQGSAALVH